MTGFLAMLLLAPSTYRLAVSLFTAAGYCVAESNPPSLLPPWRHCRPLESSCCPLPPPTLPPLRPTASPWSKHDCYPLLPPLPPRAAVAALGGTFTGPGWIPHQRRKQGG
ncbi:hypothetical protein C8J57DRAFT_1604313 [Mycena rebaudengoi]|nr:hypothetical protein C8J57DRAFT_1604313 [Mycena rebaudengoi]